MQYTSIYHSPLGEMFLSADDSGLTGLWFDGTKHYANGIDTEHEEKEMPVFRETRQWLDIYFSGKEPDFLPPLHLVGSPFQLSVWKILQEIPYGQTITYGKIAKRIADEKGIPHMSAQAVGGAVGHNRISLIVPCHRVVGANGSLTGYAGGVERKIRLLQYEGITTDGLFMPEKGTAL